MSNKPLTIFLVLSAIDLGYEVLSAHFTEIAATYEIVRLKAEWPYPDISPSQFECQEIIVA